MTLEGVTLRTLDPGVAHVDDLTISPDGTQIAYWGADSARNDGGRLFSLQTDGNSGAVPLTEQTGDADPVWSQSGDLIAFRRRTAEGWSRICVMYADGSGEQSLTEGPWIEQDPTWSPDGAWIAFKSNRDGVLSGDQVWVMDRYGNGLRQLGHSVEGTAEAPAWGHR
jgi:Tol biopolymer transport system component